MAQRRHRWHPVCPPPQGLVRPVRRDPAGVGGPTRGAAGGPRWRRTSQGFYVPADVDGSVPEQRILEQSVRLPAGGAVTGWAACRLWGAAFFDGLLPDGRTPMPVPLAIHGGNVRGDSSVRLMRDPLEPGEVVHRFGVPCVRVLRAVFDAMRTGGDLREAVVAMDMMAAAEKVSLRRMTGYLPTQTGRRGLPLVTRALDLASENSRSPNETRTRLVWVLDAGLPTPWVNRPVFDRRGRLLGIADLVDPVAGLVCEFDGADHRRAAEHSSDVGREDRFRRHGLEVCRVTGPDLAHTERLVARIRGARQRALWEPEHARRWTVVPPPWWEEAATLDELLDRRDALRELYELEDARSTPLARAQACRT